MQFTRRVTARCTAAALALCVSTLPLPVLAGPAEAETAESLYNEGRALYETADYEGAIKQWTKAYSKLSWSLENAEIKVGLLYNLAGAHEEAFGINGSKTHLNKALVLLNRFEENIPKIYGEGADADAERERVQERRERLQQKLEEANGAPPPERDIDGAIDEAEQEEADPEPEPEPEPSGESEDEDKPGRGLMIGGGIALGLGVAAGAVGVVGAVASGNDNNFDDVEDADYEGRLDQIDHGLAMNSLAISMAVVGGVLVVGGVVLLALGAKKNKAEKATARIAPALGPGQAGLIIGGRF